MNRVRALLLAVALSLAAGLTGGCRNGVELNDLAIVTMAGLDRTESGALRLSVSVVVPGRVDTPGAGARNPDGGPPLTVVSETGRTVADAIERLQYRIARQLFFGHTKVLVLGERFARNGVDAWIEFWTRYHKPRLTAYVITVPDEARDFLLAEPQLRRLPSEAVREHLEGPHGLPSTVRDFVAALTERSQSPITPRMELLPVDHGQEERPGIAYTGVGLYRQRQLVGWLSRNEVRPLAWLQGRPLLGMVTAGPEGTQISAEVVRSRSKLEVSWVNGRLAARLTAVVDLEVVESHRQIDLSDPEQVRRVEQLFRRHLTESLEATYNRLVQEYGVDALHLADKLYRSDPGAWARAGGRWGEHLAASRLQSTVSVKIRRTGKHGLPLAPVSGKGATGRAVPRAGQCAGSSARSGMAEHGWRQSGGATPDGHRADRSEHCHGSRHSAAGKGRQSGRVGRAAAGSPGPVAGRLEFMRQGRIA